jgi:hypothetical protein
VGARVGVLSGAATIGGLLFALAASAQPVSDSARAAARKLGEEAGALFEAGDYAAALEKYERADAIVHVPTLGVRAARSLVKLGRLVEASERYLAVTRMDVPAKAPKVHQEALRDAERERAALLPRIPSLVVELGAGGADAEVLLDEKPLPPALIGVEQPIDPGQHVLVVTRGGQRKEERFSVAEREKKRLALEPPGGASTDAEPAQPLPTPIEPAPLPDEKPRDGSGQRVLGYVALGVGGVGVIVGGVTGGLALGKKGGLDSRCPDRGCPPDYWNDADSYNSLRTYSTVGFVIGAIGLVGGGVLLLTAPSAASAERTAERSANARRGTRPTLPEPRLAAGPDSVWAGVSGAF